MPPCVVSRGLPMAYTRGMGRGAVVSVCLLLASGLPTRADDAPVVDIHAIADRVLAATVSVACSVDGGSFSGSGFAISPEGHVLTAASAVPQGATEVTVLLPGTRRLEATVMAVDENLGVALVKVPAEERLASLPLARRLPAVGDVAFTAADVDGVMLANGRASFSRGFVSGLYDVDKQPESPYAGRVIETTAAVNPGSDGGPLVDATGRVVGVISLAVSPQRWQGVAVPAAVVLERFAPLATVGVSVAGDDLTASVPAPPLDGLRRTASAVAPYLVGIEVERTWPPERLPRESWQEHRRSMAGWDRLSDAEKGSQFAAFAARAGLLDVNQLLRRPPGPVTGVVVSATGHVLTSSFNVGADTAFISQGSGRPRPSVSAPEADGRLVPRDNAIRRVVVVLADGSRREARVLARHEPLGIALLTIEAADLPWLDLAAAVSPQLGDHVAVVGLGSAAAGDETLNPGIVGAASRNRGYRFQTDALLNYGNSGGPVVDAFGSLLGIATAPIEPDTVQGRLFPRQQLMRWSRAPNSGVGFVARADRIRAVLDDLKAGRSFERFPGPFLGVQADESKAFGDDVVIGSVAPGSPAAKAGLKNGDVILAYDGVELSAWRDLTERIAAAKPGDAVVLTIRRSQRGPRLVIAGRDVETLDDLERLKKSLQPGESFAGRLETDDAREITVVLGEVR